MEMLPFLFSLFFDQVGTLYLPRFPSSTTRKF